MASLTVGAFLYIDFFYISRGEHVNNFVIDVYL